MSQLALLLCHSTPLLILALMLTGFIVRRLGRTSALSVLNRLLSADARADRPFIVALALLESVLVVRMAWSELVLVVTQLCTGETLVMIILVLTAWMLTRTKRAWHGYALAQAATIAATYPCLTVYVAYAPQPMLTPDAVPHLALALGNAAALLGHSVATATRLTVVQAVMRRWALHLGFTPQACPAHQHMRYAQSFGLALGLTGLVPWVQHPAARLMLGLALGVASIRCVLTATAVDDYRPRFAATCPCVCILYWETRVYPIVVVTCACLGLASASPHEITMVVHAKPARGTVIARGVVLMLLTGAYAFN